MKVVDRYIHAVPDTTDGWMEQLGKLADQIEHQPNLDLDLLTTAFEILQKAVTDQTRWRDTAQRY